MAIVSTERVRPSTVENMNAARNSAVDTRKPTSGIIDKKMMNGANRR